MKPSDLVLYLFGNRGAIERVAATRRGWLIGAILVVTAGIAWNYDHLDLLRQPEWFIGPFAASLVSICFIFLWISGPLKLRSAGSYRRQADTFLVLAAAMHPAMANRHQLQHLIEQRDYVAAVAYAAGKTRNGFPRIAGCAARECARMDSRAVGGKRNRVPQNVGIPSP